MKAKILFLDSEKASNHLNEIYYDVKKDKQVKRANKIKSDFIIYIENKAVSYTHLTLPTNREV